MAFNKGKIIEKIKQGGISMKPRWIFLFKTILLITISFLISFFSLFLFGAIIFLIFNYGVIFFRDIITVKMLIYSLPWLLILFMLVFIFVLLKCLGIITPLYRKSKLFVFVTVVLMLFIVGFVINSTQAFRYIYESKPVINNWIKKEHKKGVFRFIKKGNIIEVKESGEIFVQIESGEVFSIKTDSRFMLKNKTKFNFKEGDIVWVSIKRNDKEMEIFKIRPYNFENEINSVNGCNNKYKGRDVIPFNKF